MLSLILNLFISGLVLMITAYLVPGFEISSFFDALLAVLILGFMNFLIRPIIVMLTLPLNILTIGLFSFVINALLLNVAAGLIDGFDIRSWYAAIVGAVVLSIVQMMVNVLTPGKRKIFG